MTEALDLRSGLPTDLLVLHVDWPRAQWPELPLHPMAAHWLEVHDWFRALLRDADEALRAIAEARVEPEASMRLVRRQLGSFLANLHAHHHAETHLAFPQLAPFDARLTRGFALLDRDHEHITPLLDALERALAVSGPVEVTRALHALVPPLTRHLLDEEDLVVPLLSSLARR